LPLTNLVATLPLGVFELQEGPVGYFPRQMGAFPVDSLETLGYTLAGFSGIAPWAGFFESRL